MSWLLLLLAQHPDIQDKVRAEAEEYLPDISDIEDVTLDQLHKLRYLDATIKETQRLDIDGLVQ